MDKARLNVDLDYTQRLLLNASQFDHFLYYNDGFGTVMQSYVNTVSSHCANGPLLEQMKRCSMAFYIARVKIEWCLQLGDAEAKKGSQGKKNKEGLSTHLCAFKVGAASTDRRAFVEKRVGGREGGGERIEA